MPLTLIAIDMRVSALEEKQVCLEGDYFFFEDVWRGGGGDKERYAVVVRIRIERLRSGE